MKELVCNYALVRFLPYRETGEFVNVGVVVHCPEIDFFDYRLAKGRNSRVRGFFPELDRGVYRAALEAMKKELNRRRNTDVLFTTGRTITDDDVTRGLSAFRALLRRRETLVHFAEPGMRVAEPATVVDELFDTYVNRNFAKPREYQERVMRSELERWLREWNLRDRYVLDKVVGDDTFHLRLPFVHFDGPRAVKAIKPLDLDRPETTDIYEHGDAWVQRFHRLAGVGGLPEHMIVMIRMPEAGKQLEAAVEIRDALLSKHLDVVPFEDADRIRQLAQV
ncbi:MAG: hypothetical protein JWL69_5086 [Phycisphaerales bacterium]|nr:hypothetical protein [Phycisphaerales bacterium]MDB5354216.1 hypothetical protein [Phycisphaerales bacterium]